MAQTRTIEDDTPILPDVVAESVVEKVEAKYGITLGRAAADRLVARQARLYASNASWRKKMNARGNKGRDTLYAFMLHWLAADMKTRHPSVSRAVAEAAWYGTPLPTLNLAGFATARARRGVAAHCTRKTAPGCRR